MASTVVEKRTKRRPQERAELTRKRLLEVAVRLFSEKAYDAVTLREIEVTAGVQRNLASYHFGDKKALWRAAASYLFDELQLFSEPRLELLKDLAPRDRIALMLRTLVRFSSKRPELHRLMLQEGKADSWRLRWLTQNYVKPAKAELKAMVQDDLDLSDREFVFWYYLYIGAGATMYTMAPEVKDVHGIDVSEPGVIEEHANMLVEFLLPLARSIKEKSAA
ncbi:MAG: helix-turn-helix domain-containing protein [Pseudomonadota bacterium]